MRLACLLFLLFLTSFAVAGDQASRTQQGNQFAVVPEGQPMRNFDDIYVRRLVQPGEVPVCLALRIVHEVREDSGVDTGRYFTQSTCSYPRQLVIERTVQKPEVAR